jgi:hypothetical protein
MPHIPYWIKDRAPGYGLLTVGLVNQCESEHGLWLITGPYGFTARL